jgi:hypothetical protein
MPDKSDSDGAPDRPTGDAERPDTADEGADRPDSSEGSAERPDSTEGGAERPDAIDGERPASSGGDAERPSAPQAEASHLAGSPAGQPSSLTAQRPVQDASKGGSVAAPAARPAPPIARPAQPAARPAPLAARPGQPAAGQAPLAARPGQPAARPAPPVARPAAPVGESGPAGAWPAAAPALSVPPAWPPVLEPAGITGAEPADDAVPTPLFQQLAAERGCPDLGCTPEPIALQAAGAPAAGVPAPAAQPRAGVPTPAAQPPAVTGVRTERLLAARSPSDVADPPDDNAETGGVNADNLPQSGAGGALAGTYPQAQADDDETLPTTGPEVLAMVAMSQILLVGGAALRVAARPRTGKPRSTADRSR